MRLVLVVAGVALLAGLAGRVEAAGPGCCVCPDGRCIERVEGMKACDEKCKPDKSSAYNRGGTCTDKCSRVVNAIRRAPAQKGKGR